MATFLLPLALLVSLLAITDAQSIGVCNGKLAKNLPSDAEVVSLYQANNIGRMRIYWNDEKALEALRGSNIELILDVPKETLQYLADDASGAETWVGDWVVKYASDVKFKYIAVGNEVHPGDANAGYVLRAMENIQAAITANNLQGRIKVSTAIDTSLLGNSFPPSNTVFTDTSYIGPIIDFLVKNEAPLLANVYTYFSYISNRQSISLEYALFTSPEVVVTDKEFQYQNLFDAVLDGLYYAVEKTGGDKLQVVVSETGWPSEGGDDAATTANAGTYYKNLINHVKKGTPKRSGQVIETYLFAMFDEQDKPAGTEQHFGLFFPNKQNKYQITTFA